MHTFTAILRSLVGALSVFGLLYPVFLLLVSPLFFSPLLLVGVLYFLLALFGLFALPPCWQGWQGWLAAVGLHLSATVLLWAFCPPPSRVLLLGVFAAYLLLWWLAVGAALFAERRRPA